MCTPTPEARLGVPGHTIRLTSVASELSIERRDDARGVVLVLAGELDVVSAPELQFHLDEVLGQPHVRVMLDLNGLRFVDSAGVSVLIKAKKEADEDGSQFVLRRPTAQVHRVFAVVGMVDWLVFDER